MTANPAKKNKKQRKNDAPKVSENDANQIDDGSEEVQKVRQERLKMAKQIQDLKAEKMQRQLKALEAENAQAEAEAEQAKVEAEKPAPAAQPAEVEKPVRKAAPPAPKARLQGRHVAAIVSFFIFALGPPLITGWYMWERAHDRYISTAGFSVRTEEVGSAFELLGGVAELSGSSSTDTEILYQFIKSQEIVRSIDEIADLRAIWSKADRDQDPIFVYDAPGTIEDLTEYWQRMVYVYSDSGTGLIDVQVQAFTAEDAQLINQLIYDASLEMINRLTEIAREDATGYAREDLDGAVERLKDARSALTLFRNRTQIVDPAASIQSQMGIMTSLQAALANELIELDILVQSTNQDDPRIVRAQQRIAVIEARIIEERNKFGVGENTDPTSDAPAFADLVGEYERLAVDLEFAEGSYRAAQATLDTALAEARRQSRYLAAHIQPTLPERADGPDRFQITFLVGLFSFLIWAIGTLSAYALRDRR